MLLAPLSLAAVSLSPIQFHARLGSRVHELGRKCPVVSLPGGIVFVARHFDETLVQGEIVANGVLPPAPVLSVEWKVLHYVTVNIVQCHLPSL